MSHTCTTPNDHDVNKKMFVVQTKTYFWRYKYSIEYMEGNNSKSTPQQATDFPLFHLFNYTQYIHSMQDNKQIATAPPACMFMFWWLC